MKLALLALVAACGSPPPPPQPAAPALPIAGGSAVSCADKAALESHSNQTCTITGRYTLKQFWGKGRRDFGTWPVVNLDDGTQVMIESLWDRSKRHDEATIAKFRDHVVVVTGTLNSSPPHESPENFFHWTISPVASIELR